jgi:hypothetical protein
MTINTEIKGQLAKLLATEDLIIENRRVSTASFDVERRVLTLPLWNRASSTVYDLLVGHEVGHALFTSNEDWTKKVQVPQQFVNVTEDVRIEKLMKRKYPGLAKTFYKGYKEMNDDDFFCISDQDLSSFNLADRVNLHCKVGNFVNIPFTVKELEILSIIESAETFDDALYAAEILYKYCKDSDPQKTEQESEVQSNQEGSPQSEMENQPSESNSFEEGEEESQQNRSDDGDQPSSSDQLNNQDNPSPTNDRSDLEVSTDSNLSEKLENLNDNYYGDQIYIEIPKVECDVAIAKNSEIHEYISDHFNEYLSKLYLDAENRGDKNFNYDPFDQSDADYVKFKKSAQKEVNYLIKEFECKKAADSYARATTSRTGVLDCTKLHTYKYNEDLFKKVSVIPDGKNHGLVFVLDWSGSMSNVLLDTCKQLYSLIWFCKKANIPFDVYAFTNEWFQYERYENGAKVIPTPLYEARDGVFHISEEFRMMNLFTHKTKSQDLDDQMKNIWRIAFAYKNNWSAKYEIPYRMSLSGTPLNESILTLHQILPTFKEENKVQKVQCVVLTDGEAGWINYRNTVERNPYAYENNEKSFYLGYSSIKIGRTFIRDRKLGTTYKIEGDGYSCLTSALLRNIQDRFADVNFVGIRILENRDCNNFISTYTKSFAEIENLKKEWKKERSVIIRSSAYNVYFGLSASSLANESEFQVDEDASKSQIKRAFVKSLSTKKLNKKILSEFVSIIA